MAAIQRGSQSEGTEEGGIPPFTQDVGSVDGAGKVLCTHVDDAELVQGGDCGAGSWHVDARAEEEAAANKTGALLLDKEEERYGCSRVSR